MLGASVNLDLGEQVCGGKRFAQTVFHQGLALVVVRGDRDQELRLRLTVSPSLGDPSIEVRTGFCCSSSRLREAPPQT